MNVYPEGNHVSATVEVLDASGQIYSKPCFASWKLLDSTGKELTSGEAENVTESFVVNIAPEFNKIENGKPKGIRSIVVAFLNGDTLVSERKEFYLLQANNPLVVGVNSFVTIESAILIGSTMPKLSYLFKANESAMVDSLVNAHEEISRFRFRIPVSSRMSNVGYKSEIADRPRAITDDDVFATRGQGIKLTSLSQEEFENLPEDFRKALATAQVIEANALLSPTDQIEDRRRKGVVLETINEVKMMFSSSTPVRYPISQDALRILSPWIVRSVSIARV